MLALLTCGLYVRKMQESGRAGARFADGASTADFNFAFNAFCIRRERSSEDLRKCKVSAACRKWRESEWQGLDVSKYFGMEEGSVV